MAKPAKVLLIESYALFRQGLQSVIDGQTDMEVVGEVSNGVETLAKTRELNPDLIIVDIGMLYGRHAQTIELIKREMPDVSIVLLMTTAYDSDEIIIEAIKSGARGFIPRESDVPHLLESLRKVLKGEVVITERLLSKVLDEFTRLAQTISRTAGISASPLTSREEEIVRCMAEGLSNKEIAAQLYITERTVKNHVSSIFIKLGARNRHQAADIAREIGLVI